MNKDQLGKLLRTHVKLRPPAQRFQADTGAAFPPSDDSWFVLDVDKKEGLLLSSGGYQRWLPYDHIREFSSDVGRDGSPCLILRVQVYIQGNDVWFDLL